jgi:hypothetical protein
VDLGRNRRTTVEFWRKTEVACGVASPPRRPLEAHLGPSTGVLDMNKFGSKIFKVMRHRERNQLPHTKLNRKSHKI